MTFHTSPCTPFQAYCADQNDHKRAARYHFIPMSTPSPFQSHMPCVRVLQTQKRPLHNHRREALGNQTRFVSRQKPGAARHGSFKYQAAHVFHFQKTSAYLHQHCHSVFLPTGHGLGAAAKLRKTVAHTHAQMTAKMPKQIINSTEWSWRCSNSTPVITRFSGPLPTCRYLIV